MAGTSLGASHAPSSTPFPSVLSTRSRRLHGAFCIGVNVARIWSSRRRATDACGVHVEIGDVQALMIGRFTPTQARMIARALESAAQALELGTGREGAAS